MKNFISNAYQKTSDVTKEAYTKTALATK